MKHYSIEVKCTISASIDQVWSMLADFSGYHKWNPFVPQMECDMQIGSPIKMHVRLDPNRSKLTKQVEYLRVWDPPHTMRWGFTWGPFLTADRIQTLSVINEQTTLYYTSDTFTGWLAPLIYRFYGPKIQLGFESTAKGLKTFVEQ